MTPHVTATEPNARRHDHLGFDMSLAMVQADINSTPPFFVRSFHALTEFLSDPLPQQGGPVRPADQALGRQEFLPGRIYRRDSLSGHSQPLLHRITTVSRGTPMPESPISRSDSRGWRRRQTRKSARSTSSAYNVALACRAAQPPWNLTNSDPFKHHNSNGYRHAPRSNGRSRRSVATFSYVIAGHLTGFSTE